MFEDDAFDVIAASLVFHYMEHWEATLIELRRVMAPGGLLALSSHHPTTDWQLHAGSYFNTRQISETWRKECVSATVSLWPRPLKAMRHGSYSSGCVRAHPPVWWSTHEPDGYQ
jgi:ubiquinone/menaquinone biosynthesis C-methylase UbiE